MAPRNSQEEDDAITWATTGVRLGTAGLDLREPSAPGALTKLLNARFSDDRTVNQRDGHLALLLKDAAEFPPLGDGYTVTDEWMYGHGMRLSSANAASWENAHHPIVGRGQATFNFDGADVVWTGDRVLVVREDGCLGRSEFWSRGENVSLQRGLPAYLPLQTDSTPPAQVTGDYVETALTNGLRVHVHTDGLELVAWVIDRETNAVVERKVLATFTPV
jgi:hypothetical protein